MRIKKGDIVVVIAGKDKGVKGEVIRVISSLERVVVKGVNIVTKHVKKTQERAGERVEKEASLHVSNVMLLDSDENASRVQYGFTGKGLKVRKFQSTGKVVSENFTK